MDTAVFSYNNIDATTDLNAHFRILFRKGIVSGFELLPAAGTSNVMVQPGVLASNDGMVVTKSASSTHACVPGRRNNVVYRAVYNAPAAPTLSLEVLSDSALSTDPQRANLVVLGVVDLSSVSIVSNSVISYAGSDRTTKVGHNPCLGVYDDTSARDTAWPSVQPAPMLPGDFAIIKSETNSKPAIHLWSGTAWISFGNYEAMSASFSSHISGIGAFPGSQVHVTPDEKAALTGTFGTPGLGNRFVTEGDTDRLTTAAQKAAIDNAIAGDTPLSSTNPLIGDGLGVSVPKIVAVTLTEARDYVNISRADLGDGSPYFGAPVYVGKLGLDSASKSVSRNWFKLQDAFFSGYVDEDGPLYITDILDQTGAGAYNAASDNTNTNNAGYWNPAITGTKLRVKFNRQLAAGRTVYVSFYAKGRVSSLAPQGPYLPPATAIPSSKDAYREIDTAVVRSLTVETSDMVSAILNPGTAALPSFRFRDGLGNIKNTGFYYAGNIVELAYSVYGAVGITVNSDTVALFAKSTEGDDTGLDSMQAPLMFEQVRVSAPGGSGIVYRIHAHQNTYVGGGAALSLGTSSYASGYTANISLDNDSTNVHKHMIVDSGKQMRLGAGSAAAPSLSIGGTGTGFYNVGTFSSADLSLYNAVGLSLNGRTAVVFASNTANADGLGSGFATPLMFEQYMETSGACGYRIAIVQSESGQDIGSIQFGRASYADDFIQYGQIDRTGFVTVGTATASAGFVVGNEENAYGRFHATPSSMVLQFASSSKYTYTLASDTTTLSSAKTAVQQLTANSIVLSGAGSEAAPAISISGSPSTGLYYTAAYTSTGVSSNRVLGFSLDGSTVLMIGRNEIGAPGLSAASVPLLIEQAIDGSSAEIRVSAVRRDASVTNILRLGHSDYNEDFTPYMDIGNGRVYVHTDLRGVGNIIINGYLSADSISITQAITGSRFRTAGSTTASVAYSVDSDGNSGLYGNSGIVGLVLNGNTVLSANNSGLTLSVPVSAATATINTLNVTTLNTAPIAFGTIVAGAGNVTGAQVKSFFDGLRISATPPANYFGVTGAAITNFFDGLGLSKDVSLLPPGTEAVSGSSIFTFLTTLGSTDSLRAVVATYLAQFIDDRVDATPEAIAADVTFAAGRRTRTSTDGREYSLFPRKNAAGAVIGADWLSSDFHVSSEGQDLGTEASAQTLIAGTWKDVVGFETNFVSYIGGANDTWYDRGPGRCVEIDVAFQLSTTSGDGGIGTLRDNIAFRLVFIDNVTIWEGRLLYTARPDVGGSDSVWCIRFYSDGKYPNVPGAGGLDALALMNVGCMLQATVTAGSALMNAVAGARAIRRFRQSLPLDLGYIAVVG